MAHCHIIYCALYPSLTVIGGFSGGVVNTVPRTIGTRSTISLSIWHLQHDDTIGKENIYILDVVKKVLALLTRRREGL